MLIDRLFTRWQKPSCVCIVGVCFCCRSQSARKNQGDEFSDAFDQTSRDRFWSKCMKHLEQFRKCNFVNLRNEKNHWCTRIPLCWLHNEEDKLMHPLAIVSSTQRSRNSYECTCHYIELQNGEVMLMHPLTIAFITEMKRNSNARACHFSIAEWRRSTDNNDS